MSAAVAGTGIAVSGATGSVTITNTGVQSFNGGTGTITFFNYVTSFNGLTGAVTGITAGGANTFTALNSFSAGISAAGGVTFSGTFSGATGAFSKLLSASAGVSAGGNVVFNALTAVFGASAANTTPITVYKDNATDNPAVDSGYGWTNFYTPNNKVPLTLSFTEVTDPNSESGTSIPDSIMIRVQDQTTGLDTFTVRDTGRVSCANLTTTDYVNIGGGLSVDGSFSINDLYAGSISSLYIRSKLVHANYAPLRISADGDGEAFPSTTIIGDIDAVQNNTYLSVDDSLSEIVINASSAITLGGPVAASSTVTIGSGSVVQGSVSGSTTSTTITTLIGGLAYSSVKFFIQARNTTTGTYQITEIVATKDATTTVVTSTPVNTNTGGVAAVYTVNVSGGNNAFRLRATSTAASETVFTVFYTGIP